MDADGGSVSIDSRAVAQPLFFHRPKVDLDAAIDASDERVKELDNPTYWTR